MNKRYAIVRVDDVEEEIKWLDILDEIVKKRKIFIDYGDTKRQLIKKVATAILRTLKDGEILKYKEFGTGFIKQPVSVEYLAESIVEFLGVE